MRKIFIALIIIVVIFLLLVVGLFVLRSSFGRTCTLIGCIERVTIITNDKFSDDISILADGEVVLDLCQFNETERARNYERLYEDSDNEFKDQDSYMKIGYPGVAAQQDPQRFIELGKYKISDIDIWQIFVQPDCIGQKQLLYQIEKKDVKIKKTYPNGRGCGTCVDGVIDLSS